ncbi:NAD(P)/FAD-dependent oxidoreductase [Amycolatopsis dongchuanensis]|uniref:FAD dependent oxidoreductase domain-containing protein n=1 Tax=Amycolatopsis dongchuanensis TaxID=1070866 RepID=A0ABP9QRU0_9PSEU
MLAVAGRDADVIVVGAGGTGSAAAWQLAAGGARVVVLEAGRPGCGASGTLAFRVADGELAGNRAALRSLPLWREAEQETGVPVLTLTGAVAHGRSAELDVLAWTADAVGKPGRWVPPEEAVERWPGLRCEDRIFFHPLAGRLDASAALRALRGAAAQSGCIIRYGEPVTEVRPRQSDLVEVRTGQGCYRARRVVVAAGVRSAALVPGLPPLRPMWTRSVRFAPVRPDLEWPVFQHYLDPPALAAHGYASGVRGAGTEVDFAEPAAAEVDCRADAPRTRALARYVEEWLPGADPASVTLSAPRCEFVSDAVLDRRGPVVVACGLAGRGLPVLPVVGRVLAALVTTGEPHPAAP